MLGVEEQSPDAGRSRRHVNLGATGGHVIVCGLSNLGLRIAEQLHEAAVPCVVVDDGGEAFAWKQLTRWEIPVVRESSRTIASLVMAGIGDAAAVIAAHDSDLANLETALLVSDMSEDAPDRHVVVRLANPRLAEQLNAALPHAVVLSLPEKSGSSFVEGCIQSDARPRLRIRGRADGGHRRQGLRRIPDHAAARLRRPHAARAATR